MRSPARLTDITNEKNLNSSLLLTNKNSILFKMSIEHSLDNRYDFKKIG